MRWGLSISIALRTLSRKRLFKDRQTAGRSYSGLFIVFSCVEGFQGLRARAKSFSSRPRACPSLVKSLALSQRWTLNRWIIIFNANNTPCTHAILPTGPDKNISPDGRGRGVRRGSLWLSVEVEKQVCSCCWRITTTFSQKVIHVKYHLILKSVQMIYLKSIKQKFKLTHTHTSLRWRARLWQSGLHLSHKCCSSTCSVSPCVSVPSVGAGQY